MKKIIFIILILLIASLGLFLTSKVFATNNDNVTICHKNNGNGWSKITVDDDAVNGQGNGDHNTSQHQNGQDIIPPGYWDNNGRNWTTEGQAIYNNNCNVPQPTPTPTATPTVTPEVTPTPTEEPDPCENEEVSRIALDIDPCEEPTPTPTEEPTPTPIEDKGGWSPEPEGNRSTTNAPGVCSINDIGDVANINVLTGTPNDGKLTVQWSLPQNADKVHILYRQYDEDFKYALRNTPNDGEEEIGGLKNGVNYAFKVAGVRACGVGNYSKEFDPLP